MSRRSRNSSSRRRRVVHRNAKRSLPTTVTPTRSITRHPTYLLQSEDRRTYHPEGIYRPASSRFQSFHRLEVPRDSAIGRDPWGRVAFSSPQNVFVCIRRKIRKEVLHALKKAGKRGQKAPRRSAYSDIQC